MLYYIYFILENFSVMNHFKFESNNDDMGVTIVENIFINHFMPKARGDYVKVYLYGLKCTQNRIEDMPSNRRLASLLGIDEITVGDAFRYWHEKQILEYVHLGRRNYEIIYKNIATMVFTPDKFRNNGSYSDTIKSNSKRQHMFTELEKEFRKDRDDGGMGRPITHNEMEMFSDWMEEYSFSTETVKLIVLTMMRDRKNKNPKYWDAVARDFSARGVSTYDEAMKELRNNEERYRNYMTIQKYLGLNSRGTFLTKPERVLIDKWFDEYGLDLGQILLACDKTTGTGSPSLKYVDSIIRSDYLGEKIQSNSYGRKKRGSSKTTLQADIDYNNYNPDPASLEDLISGED